MIENRHSVSTWPIGAAIRSETKGHTSAFEYLLKADSADSADLLTNMLEEIENWTPYFKEILPATIFPIIKCPSLLASLFQRCVAR